MAQRGMRGGSSELKGLISHAKKSCHPASPDPLNFLAVHLNSSLYGHTLRVGVGLHWVNHRATVQSLPPALQPLPLSPSHTARPHLLFTRFPPRHSAGLALAQPLVPSPWQLCQIVSIFLRATSTSHPPHACSVEDSHLLCSWA